MRQIIHEALKWTPRAIFAGAMLAAGIWEKARDWIADIAARGLAMMADPVFATVVIFVAVCYIAALVLTKEKAEKRAPEFVGRVDSVIHGGTITERPDVVNFMLQISVTNIGTMPSAALFHDWRLELELGTEAVPVQLTATQNEIALGGIGGHTQIFKPDDQIITKMETPLAVGDVVRGYLWSLMPNDVYQRASGGAVIIICFKDVLGKNYKVRYPWSPKFPSTIPFIPFTRKVQ